MILILKIINVLTTSQSVGYYQNYNGIFNQVTNRRKVTSFKSIEVAQALRGKRFEVLSTNKEGVRNTEYNNIILNQRKWQFRP